MQLIETILGKKNNIKVLRHLIKHRDWQFNITELSRDINVNKGILSRLIKDLEKENVIRTSVKGKIKLFSVNKENLFIRKVIIPLFEKESSFYYDELTRFVNAVKEEAISIIAYGSVVSGTIKLTSDIDILVIISKKTESLEKQIDKLRKEFLDDDLLLTIDLMGLEELRKLYKEKEPFINSLIKNNRTLYGKPLKELIE
jgi:predicted nucleotidyltransferase